MKLYDHPFSGNGYKVRLLLAHLGTKYEHVEVDILAGEARTAAFRMKNPIGKVPVLELDDGRTLSESNAILFWLARDTRYWPTELFAQGQALRWLFFEQREHMPNVGGARFWSALYQGTPTRHQREALEEMRAKGAEALRVLDEYLVNHEFLAGDRYSIADISLYAYTHLAPEGGIDLGPFAAIDRWLRRIQMQAGHVGIER